ncbi:uncharacterized protein LOC108912495 [Anoplophora glabripennis]|uniref:uncharacterized protein LOC108912495 n=1 Tax=Anoplophora glabripennis TaxID=217634 RepID=UPI0008739F1E|nr:uncharacterized protein LOC108912495 [Anoplophora glabripennis]
MCESHINSTEDLDSDQTEEILGLNNWEPKSKERNINKLASQKTAGGEGSLKASQKSAKTEVCICEPPEAPQDTESVETIVSDRIHITPNTNRYKLVNLIGEKRRTGAYSRWRKNVTQPCTCEVETCDCNLNPAIISWKPADETCGCGQLQCQCKIDSGEDGAKEGKAAERTDVEEEMSQQCLCGNKNCTCNRKSPELKKSEDTVILPSLSSSYGSTKDLSSKSKETIIVKLGEAEPHHTEDLYQPGPIKKSSKADVTKCDDIYSSHITLVSNKIELNEEECLCTEECNDCMKPKVSKSKTMESNQ